MKVMNYDDSNLLQFRLNYTLKKAETIILVQMI